MYHAVCFYLAPAAADDMGRRVVLVTVNCRVSCTSILLTAGM